MLKDLIPLISLLLKDFFHVVVQNDFHPESRPAPGTGSAGPVKGHHFLVVTVQPLWMVKMMVGYGWMKVDESTIIDH